MQISNNVKYIISELYKNNFEAFIVGGSVRDFLLNKKPKDFDIATNALPQDIINIFEKTIPTGIKHGTITVLINNESFEITTYRIDGEYKDNRHPKEVIFVSNIEKDLSRRDFTINAMAYNEKEGLIDFFNGKEDLKNKIIKTVGESNKRFKEDALRILRAIRFSCQLDFSIEENTLKAIKENRHLISNISIERIRDEFIKILLSQTPSKGLILLKNCNLLNLIIPELEVTIGFDQRTPYHNKDVFNHTLQVLDNVPSNLILRLAALFHDIGKPHCFFLDENNIGHFYGHNKKSEEITKFILKRLKFDNETINKVCILIKEHMNVLVNPKDSTLKKMINRVGENLIFDLFTLQKEDIKATAPPFLYLEKVDYMEAKCIEILNSKAPISTKHLNLNGNDLINYLNIKPGKIIGEILDILLDKVLDNPQLNNKEILLNLSKKILKDINN